MDWNTAKSLDGQTVNGVQLTLPEIGMPSPPSNPPGTSVSDGATENLTYDGLLALWDANNGTSTDSGTFGGVPGWHNDDYWSNTVSPSGHYVLNFYAGGPKNDVDTYPELAAYRVL